MLNRYLLPVFIFLTCLPNWGFAGDTLPADGDLIWYASFTEERYIHRDAKPSIQPPGPILREKQMWGCDRASLTTKMRQRAPIGRFFVYGIYKWDPTLIANLKSLYLTHEDPSKTHHVYYQSKAPVPRNLITGYYEETPWVSRFNKPGKTPSIPLGQPTASLVGDASFVCQESEKITVWKE